MNSIKKMFAVAALVLAPGMAFADQGAVSVLNEMLKGEISAVETYRQALEKMSNDSSAMELKKFHDEHQKAVTSLQAEVVKLGGTPTQSSGAWGVWAEAVTGAAKTFGKETALKALKEGEEHGVKEYKEVLQNQNAPMNIKDMVKTTFLPQQEKHIEGLSRMISEKKNS